MTCVAFSPPTLRNTGADGSEEQIAHVEAMFYLIHWRDLGHPIRSSCGLFVDKRGEGVSEADGVSEAEGDGGGVSGAGATRTIEPFSE